MTIFLKILIARSCTGTCYFLNKGTFFVRSVSLTIFNFTRSSSVKFVESPIQLMQASLTLMQSNVLIETNISAVDSEIYLSDQSTVNISYSIFESKVLQLRDSSLYISSNSSTTLQYFVSEQSTFYSRTRICVGNITTDGASNITLFTQSFCARTGKVITRLNQIQLIVGAFLEMPLVN